MSRHLMSVLRDLGRTPRFHGNGFAQLYLTGDERLHVWHPHLPPRPDHNASIHSHTYAIWSTVLLGCLQQVHWAEPMRDPKRPGGRPDSSTSRTHDLWELRDYDKAIGHEGMFTYIRTLCLVETSRCDIRAGASYVLGRDQMHDSVAIGLTATLFERRHQPDDRRAPWVAAPLSQEPSNAFASEHQPSADTLWSIIGEAVVAMSQMARDAVLARVQPAPTVGSG